MLNALKAPADQLKHWHRQVYNRTWYALSVWVFGPFIFYAALASLFIFL